MAAEWFCKRGTRQFGPFSTEALGVLAQRGQLNPSDLIREGHQGPWIAARAVQGLFTVSRPDRDGPAPTRSAAVADEPMLDVTRSAYDVELRDETAADSRRKRSTAGDETIKRPASKSGGGEMPRRMHEAWRLAVQSVPALEPRAARRPRASSLVRRAAPEVWVRRGAVSVIATLLVVMFFIFWRLGESNGLSPTRPSAENSVAMEAALRDKARMRAVTEYHDLPSAAGDGAIAARATLEKAWLAADANGESIDRSGLARAQYLFLRVRLTNLCTSSLTYRSWNEDASGDSPVTALVKDNAGQRCPMVPVEETPDVERLTTRQLAPGQTVTDVLVFRVPQASCEYVRLGLDASALGLAGLATFEVPRGELLRDPHPIAVHQPVGDP